MTSPSPDPSPRDIRCGVCDVVIAKAGEGSEAVSAKWKTHKETKGHRLRTPRSSREVLEEVDELLAGLEDFRKDLEEKGML